MAEEQQLGEPEYLGWRLLVRLKEQSGDQVSRSKFLKLCCLADRHILEEYDYEVGMPRYWYMYGELGSQHDFSSRFFNAPSALGWEGQQYLPKRDLRPSDFDLSDEGLRGIEDGLHDIVSRWGRENVESIKQYQYQHQAPTPFIPAYSELRWQLQNVDLENQARLDEFSTGESTEEYIGDLLDEMVGTYPVEEYSEMYDLFLRWEDTVRMMLDSSPDYGAIEEFLDQFIEALSKVVLRFEHSSNISQERREEWVSQARAQKAEFEKLLRQRRRSFIRSRGETSRTHLESVSESFSQTVREDINSILSDQ
ncbi:hypothetical protein [Halolamina sp.]|uniref:hypothetical protein n=1 Tax=Halolamina sp. TaxID=1940283 RepID=UPI00356A52C0